MIKTVLCDFNGVLDPETDEAHMVIDWLKAQQIKIIGVTNMFLQSGNIVADKYGIEHLYCVSEYGLSKAKAPLYQKIIAEMGINPNESLFIDDAYTNLEAAQSLGITTVLVGNTSDTTVHFQIKSISGLISIIDELNN